MDRLTFLDRRLFLAGAAALPLGASAQGVQALNIAVIGEPGPLEPTNTTASLIGEIDQHIYEGLYAFNLALEPVPLLAAALPQTTPDGKTYLIPLRENVPFHDGTIMTAEDVVVCLSGGWRRRRVAGRRRPMSSAFPHRTPKACRSP